MRAHAAEQEPSQIGQHRLSILVPGLQPWNALPRRLLPPVTSSRGRSLGSSVFRGKSLGTRKENWARPDSVLPPVKIPSAERRAYSTPVAPPTGQPSAANVPAFGNVRTAEPRIHSVAWQFAVSATDAEPGARSLATLHHRAVSQSLNLLLD